MADARFAKPFDRELVERLARHHEVLLTVEEGSTGGFGALVLHHLADTGLLDGVGATRRLRVRTLALPDRFIDHDTPASPIKQAGLDADAITAQALRALGVGEEDPRALAVPAQ